METLIHKILKQKKLGMTLVVLFIFAIIAASCTLRGIHRSVQEMADYANETVTYFPAYPVVNPQGKNAELIKRGEYLSKAGDCMACHTNTEERENAKPFAGGLAMRTPFGTIYTPNITPDKETGIGNWTEDQFIKAMHEGISPHGHYYYPAFPYLYFNKVSIDDLKAIKAYLDVIPAVHQENRKNRMVFPFNLRFMQLGWRLLFFHSHEFEKDPSQSDAWNRGAYLAQGLGHCAMCHSPSYHILSEEYPLGAPMQKYNLTGGRVQGFLAPNITKTNLSSTSIDDIINVFTKDTLIGGGKIEGPMLEVNHDSLNHLTHEDLVALATYLKNVESITPPKPKGSAVGKGIYDTYCSGCHESGAGGAPKYGDSLSWTPVLKQGIEQVYTNAIQGKGGMPAKGTCLSCSDDEIKQAVDFMISSSKGGGEPSVATPRPKPLTMEDGKRLYDANCAVCHNSGFKNAPKPGDIAAWKPIVDQGFLQIYGNVLTGRNGHPVRGACANCTDQDIKAATKYMLQQSAPDKNFNLW